MIYLLILICDIEMLLTEIAKYCLAINQRYRIIWLGGTDFELNVSYLEPTLVTVSLNILAERVYGRVERIGL